jgi:sulfate adenylyltransferase
VKGFTGIDDPYEVPENPDVALDTSTMSADEASQYILLYLVKEVYVENP